MRVLICGGGIVGASIAYFLGRRGVAPIVIERSGLACAASGKGGGFLAAEWCDGTPVEPLARRSFALHAELPGALEDDWGYRRLDTYGGSIASGLRARPGGFTRSWLSDDVALDGLIGCVDLAMAVPAGSNTASPACNLILRPVGPRPKSVQGYGRLACECFSPCF